MTEDYLAAWSSDAVGRHPLRLRVPVTAREEYKRQTNAGAYAGITVVAEPADDFAVSVELPPGVLQQMRETDLPYAGGSFLDEAVFGVLDVLVTADTFPLLGLRLRLVEARIHVVDSKPFAFRMVGRQVGRRIVTEHLQAH